MLRIFLGLFAICNSIDVPAQANRIDNVRSDAPELAQFGTHDIGVRTLELTDYHRPDVVNSIQGEDTAYYDRTLTVEVWYPALLEDGQQVGTAYETATRNLAVTATLLGRAVRNAESLGSLEPMPLVVISHGYPGNRYLLSHLGENLASKGYVVAAIDHRDSTYRDQQAITSALYNKPIDQLFVLDQIAVLSADSDGFLAGLVDTDNTAIVGYSMGGYGLLINLGAGYSDVIPKHGLAPPNGLAQQHAASNPNFGNNLDPRIKAGFAIAPWGMKAGVWDPQELQDVRVPTFFLAGSNDLTAGYEEGVRAIFENTTQSDRYLLTFVNAGHNAGAPIPLPSELGASADQTGADHYTDPVWNSLRMNNIMDHFATAYFDYILKGDSAALEYLELLPNSNDGDWNAGTYWKGFQDGTARSLHLEHLEVSE